VHPTKHLSDNIGSVHTCYDTYEDRVEVINTINSKFTRLRSLYESLRNDGVNGRRVYVIGYPQVAKVDGECGLNVQMNAEEIKFARDLITYLNSVIKRAADEAGVQYVDTEAAFDGSRLCEAPAGQHAMNGFTISKTPDGGYDFTASFHPNKRGHEMLAATIAAQTSNLTKPMPTPLPKTNEVALNPNLAILQNVPKTNRAVRYIQVADNLVDKVLERGKPVSFTAKAQDYMTKVGGVYNLVMHSEPVNLGSFTADANGDVNVTAAVPADTPPGFHTIHLYGNDMFGNLIDIQQVVFVEASSSDKDGDGVLNESDSCVLAAQSNIDADVDNIDDVCDPLISAPPVTPPQEPEGIIWQDDAVLTLEIQGISGP
jgi:hypothetical protein